MPKHVIIWICGILANQYLHAQDSTKTNLIKWSGYAELFYSYDFGNPSNHTKPSFQYNHARHNEVNINLGFVKAAYETASTRANLALMAGTYTNANLAAEPSTLKNLYEANVGVKISRSEAIWVDVGVLPSHIGFESAIGKDCWTLTRSILAENSPYFETGAKLSYQSKNTRWQLSTLILNGWQRIQRLSGNSLPSFGTQVQYKPNQNTTLNYSTFIGSDEPDSTRKMRYFNNWYGVFNLPKHLQFIVGFDLGLEQKAKNNNAFSIWYSPVVILRMPVAPASWLNLRAEYYQDKAGVMALADTGSGLQTWGFSANFDWVPWQNLLWRLEAKHFASPFRQFSSAAAPLCSPTPASLRPLP